jgi:hypothetical protein
MSTVPVAGAFVVVVGDVVAGVSHIATPPWCEQLPEWVCENE